MELRFLSCLGQYFMALCVLFVRCVIIDNTFQHPEISPLKTGPPGGHLLSLSSQVLIKMNFNDTFSISVDGFCDLVTPFALMNGHSSWVAHMQCRIFGACGILKHLLVNDILLQTNKSHKYWMKLRKFPTCLSDKNPHVYQGMSGGSPTYRSME